MSLPWERWQPVTESIAEPEPITEPPLPYTPPPQTPPPPPPAVTPDDPGATVVTVEGDQVKALAKDVFAEAMNYVKETMAAAKQDMQVDHTHPTIIATTAEGKKLVVADARNRSARTLIQGLAVDLLAALVVVIGTLGGADLMQKDTWIAFAVLLAKSFISAGISYFMRLKVAPTVRAKGEQMQVMPLMIPKPEKPVAA